MEGTDDLHPEGLSFRLEDLERIKQLSDTGLALLRTQVGEFQLANLDVPLRFVLEISARGADASLRVRIARLILFLSFTNILTSTSRQICIDVYQHEAIASLSDCDFLPMRKPLSVSNIP